jgi:hypothetical protein
MIFPEFDTTGKMPSRGSNTAGNRGHAPDLADRHAMNLTGNFGGDWTLTEATRLSGPSFPAPTSQIFPSLDWSNQPPFNSSNIPAQSVNFNSSNQADFSAQVTFAVETPPRQQSSDVNQHKPPPPTDPASSAASPTTTRSASQSSLLDPLQFFHHGTGRPARKLLDHEKVLLDELYLIKNPKAPNPTARDIEEWRLSLPVTEMDEWNDFVALEQNQEQAKQRLESFAEHESLILDIVEKEGYRPMRKDRSLRRGRRPGQATSRKGNKSGKKDSVSKYNQTPNFYLHFGSYYSNPLLTTVLVIEDASEDEDEEEEINEENKNIQVGDSDIESDD